MLVNLKLGIKGYIRITFQGQMLHWTGGFLIAEQKKRSWQCCHSRKIVKKPNALGSENLKTIWIDTCP